MVEEQLQCPHGLSPLVYGARCESRRVGSIPARMIRLISVLEIFTGDHHCIRTPRRLSVVRHMEPWSRELFTVDHNSTRHYLHGIRQDGVRIYV